MKSVRTVLWFADRGLEAAELYVSLVPDSRITHVMRAPADNPSTPEGAVLTVNFELKGIPYMLLIGGPMFPQSEAVSIMLECDTQEEVDFLWDSLIADGGKPSECGWLKDKFGVSWQITPSILNEYITSGDPLVAKRAFESMMTMSKIDIATLEKAVAG